MISPAVVERARSRLKRRGAGRRSRGGDGPSRRARGPRRMRPLVSAAGAKGGGQMGRRLAPGTRAPGGPSPGAGRGASSADAWDRSGFEQPRCDEARPAAVTVPSASGPGRADPSREPLQTAGLSRTRPRPSLRSARAKARPWGSPAPETPGFLEHFHRAPSVLNWRILGRPGSSRREARVQRTKRSCGLSGQQPASRAKADEESPSGAESWDHSDETGPDLASSRGPSRLEETVPEARRGRPPGRAGSCGAAASHCARARSAPTRT